MTQRGQQLGRACRILSDRGVFRKNARQILGYDMMNRSDNVGKECLPCLGKSPRFTDHKPVKGYRVIGCNACNVIVAESL